MTKLRQALKKLAAMLKVGGDGYYLDGYYIPADSLVGVPSRRVTEIPLEIIQSTRRRQVWSIATALARFTQLTGALQPELKGFDETRALETEPERMKEKSAVNPSTDIYVVGSGLVRVPSGRVNEIPKVIQEHNEREAKRARLLIFARR